MFSEDTPVPFRYLSDDGLCAIDIVTLDPGYGSADDFSISEAAGAVLVNCVFKSNMGGSVRLGE